MTNKETSSNMTAFPSRTVANSQSQMREGSMNDSRQFMLPLPLSLTEIGRPFSFTQEVSAAAGMSLVQAVRLTQCSSASKAHMPMLFPASERLSACSQRAHLSNIIEDVLDLLQEDDDDDIFFDGPSLDSSTQVMGLQDASRLNSSSPALYPTRQSNSGPSRRAPSDSTSRRSKRRRSPDFD